MKRHTTLGHAICLSLGALLATTSAMSATAQAAEKVGVAAQVNPDAFGSLQGRVRKTIYIGDNVQFGQRIETTDTGLVQVLLVDGSTFTVGPNADLVIDEFVYDPNAGAGHLIATFAKGVARFVGGKLSKNRGGVTVKTPAGTIGIRGGMADLNVSESGEANFSLLFGEEITFQGNDGKKKRIFEPGYSLNAGGSGGGSGIRKRTPGETANALNSMQGGGARRGGSSTSSSGQGGGLSLGLGGNNQMSPVPTSQALSKLRNAANSAGGGAGSLPSSLGSNLNSTRSLFSRIHGSGSRGIIIGGGDGYGGEPGDYLDE